jgi:glutamyl-tRNA synthetase
VPFLAKRGLSVDAGDRTLAGAMAHLKPRATSLVELAEGLDYFFREPPEFDEAAKKKQLVADAAPRLSALADAMAGVEPFEPAPLEAAVNAWLEREQLTMKDFAQAARVALTGRTKSPGLFDVIALLGKDRALARIRRGAEIAQGS